MSWGNSYPSKLYFKKSTGRYEARGRYSAYFDPKRLIARSPESHTFLKRINGRLLITYCSGTYFEATVMGLLKGKHKVTHVDVDCSLDKFKAEGLKTRYEELYRLQAELIKKGLRNTTKEYHRSRIQSLDRQITKLKALGAGYPLKERKLIQARELNRVTAENAAYTERDPIALFKADLLANSFRNT